MTKTHKHDWRGGECTCGITKGAYIDQLEVELKEKNTTLSAWKKEVDLLTHKIITCGAAASHSNADLTKSGAYKEKWDSPQAETVRKLRARAEKAEQALADARAESKLARESLMTMFDRKEELEQALALRGEPVAWAHKDHLENALVIVNRVKKVWEELKIDNAENYTIPLYAAPISGERVREALKGLRAIIHDSGHGTPTVRADRAVAVRAIIEADAALALKGEQK